MSDVLKKIAELKVGAKNRRDFERYDRALAMLEEAISQASDEYKKSTNIPEWRETIASELADCWGILGGVQRRWALKLDDGSSKEEHLRKAADAYDAGYKYESEAGVNTYNRLNRLLVRLLLDPERLRSGQSPSEFASTDTVNVKSELEQVAELLEKQDADNVWVAADRALLNVLLGRQDAASAYAPFERKGPPDFACRSALDGIAPLAAINLPTAVELKAAHQRLKHLLQRFELT